MLVLQTTENLAQSGPNKEGNLLVHMIGNPRGALASDKLLPSSSVTVFLFHFSTVFWGIDCILRLGPLTVPREP